MENTGEQLPIPQVEKVDYRQLKGRELDVNRHDQLPTYVIWDETLQQKHIDIANQAIKKFFKQTDLKQEKLQFLGNWKSPESQNQNGQIAKFESVEWNVRSSLVQNNKIDVNKAVNHNMFFDIYQQPPKGQPHWEILLTNRDLHCDGLNFVLGNSVPDLGTIISFNRIDKFFKENPQYKEYSEEVAETIIMHELGHTIFNLPLDRRGEDKLDVETLKVGGSHCKNKGCCMQQGLGVKDFLRITTERDKDQNPFCNECIEDLKINYKA